MKIEKLIEIFGRDNVSTEKSDLLVYSTDASMEQGEPIVIVWATNTEQIRKLMIYANRVNLNVVPRGYATSLAGGTIPLKSIVLDLSKLNHISKINLLEKTATVEPAVVLSVLNKKLEEFNLQFPIISQLHTVSTIGGIIATNNIGLKPIKYGSIKDWISEIEFIDGTGKLYQTNKVKDFIGSEGTLCVITKIKLKLTKPIEKTTANTFQFTDINKLVEKIKQLKTEPNIISIEFFDKLSAKLLGLIPLYYLYVTYESEEGDIKNTNFIDQRRNQLNKILSAHSYTHIEKLQLNTNELPHLILSLYKNKIPSYGNIGYGIITSRFKKIQLNLIPKIIQLVTRLNGKIIEIGLTKKPYVNEEFKQKIKELKIKYDPSNILNRGKII